MVINDISFLQSSIIFFHTDIHCLDSLFGHVMLFPVIIMAYKDDQLLFDIVQECPNVLNRQAVVDAVLLIQCRKDNRQGFDRLQNQAELDLVAIIVLDLFQVPFELIRYAVILVNIICHYLKHVPCIGAVEVMELEFNDV